MTIKNRHPNYLELMLERSKKGSKKAKAAIKAQQWLDDDALFLDTETTGVSDNDQVIEVAIIDKNGLVLLDTRLRPTVDIHPKAQRVHGISAEALIDAPTWTDIAPRLRLLLEGRKVVAFNSEFDARLLRQTAQAFGDDIQMNDWCAMNLAVRAYGATSSYYNSISLNDAVDAAGIEWQGQSHSALGDALTMLGLVKTIAALYDDEPGEVTFDYLDKHYPKIYKALWHREHGAVDLISRDDEQYHFPRQVTEEILDLVAILEAYGIPVERVGELQRFDLVNIVGQLPSWQKAFECLQAHPEGNLEDALCSCPGVSRHDDLTLESDELVNTRKQQRYPVLARSPQFENIYRGDVDYIFTERFCYCPSRNVYRLDEVANQDQGPDQDQQRVGHAV